MFGGDGKHGYHCERIDSSGHRLVCPGCDLVVEGSHEWDSENCCSVCRTAGVSAARTEDEVVVTVYHLPDGADRILTAAYGADGRLIEVKEFTEANYGQIVFDQSGIFDVRLFVLDENWVPVDVPITAG